MELYANIGKAKRILNWEPKVSLEELIQEMINEDSNEANKEFLLNKKGLDNSLNSSSKD